LCGVGIIPFYIVNIKIWISLINQNKDD